MSHLWVRDSTRLRWWGDYLTFGKEWVALFRYANAQWRKTELILWWPERLSQRGFVSVLSVWFSLSITYNHNQTGSAWVSSAQSSQDWNWGVDLHSCWARVLLQASVAVAKSTSLWLEDSNPFPCWFSWWECTQLLAVFSLLFMWSCISSKLAMGNLLAMELLSPSEEGPFEGLARLGQAQGGSSLSPLKSIMPCNKFDHESDSSVYCQDLSTLKRREFCTET